MQPRRSAPTRPATRTCPRAATAGTASCATTSRSTTASRTNRLDGDRDRSRRVPRATLTRVQPRPRRPQRLDGAASTGAGAGFRQRDAKLADHARTRPSPPAPSSWSSSSTAAPRSRAARALGRDRLGGARRRRPRRRRSPSGAPTWFPCNDHPVRQGELPHPRRRPMQAYTVVANGALGDHRGAAGRATWVYVQREPTATYLATVQIGRYVQRSSPLDGAETRCTSPGRWTAASPPTSRRCREMLALSRRPSARTRSSATPSS